MRNQKSKILPWFCCLLFLFTTGRAIAQQDEQLLKPAITNRIPEILDGNGRLIPGRIGITSAAYEQKAFAALLQEANQIANDLNLVESRPILQTNLTQVFLVGYGMSQLPPKMIGNIHTTNYAYFAASGHKLSYVEAEHQDENSLKWMKQYHWPKTSIDTNNAFQLASQWMVAAHMDVEKLNRDCHVYIEPDQFVNQGLQKTKYFVPVYFVSWVSEHNKREGHGNVASVKLLAPTKELISLRVEDSKYILRNPIEFTNVADLFPDVAPIPRNLPAKPNLPVETKTIDAAKMFPIVEPKWPQNPPNQ